MKVLYIVQDNETRLLDVLICQDETGGLMLESQPHPTELRFEQTHTFLMEHLDIIVEELQKSGLIVQAVPEELQGVFLERCKDGLH